MNENVNKNSNMHNQSIDNYTKCKNMLDYYIDGIELHNESMTFTTLDHISTQVNNMIANIQNKDKILELQTKLNEFKKLATTKLKLNFDNAIKLENNDNISLSKEYETDILPALSGLINSHSPNTTKSQNINNSFTNNYVDLNAYQKAHAFEESKKLLSDWIERIELGNPIAEFNKNTIIYVNKFVKEIGQYVPDLEADKYDTQIVKILNKFNTLARDYVYDGLKGYEKHNVESPNSKSNIAKSFSEDKIEFSEFQKLFAFEESKNLLADWIKNIESGKPIANLSKGTIAYINKFVKQLDEHMPYSQGNKNGIELGKLNEKFNTLAKNYVSKNDKKRDDDDGPILDFQI